MSAPRLLRAALRTWPRHDRSETGEVVLATALDMIDAGGSPRREAVGLVRGGLELRVRGIRRELRLAPWGVATRLAVIGCALLATCLAVISGGGVIALGHAALWSVGLERHLIPGVGQVPAAAADAALPIFAVTTFAIACLAFARRMVLATLASVCAAVMLGVMRGHGYGLGSAGLDYQLRAHATGRYDARDWLVTQIELDGLVGWLLFACALGAAAWAVTHWRGPGHAASVPPTGPPARRRSRTVWLGFVAAAITALIVAPAVARAIASPMADAFGPVDRDTNAGVPAQTAAYVLLLAFAAVGIAVVALRRRGPGAAHAAGLVGAVLWAPAMWMVLGAAQTFDASPPFVRLLGETVAVIAFYLYATAIGGALTTAAVASAGRHWQGERRVPARVRSGY